MKQADSKSVDEMHTKSTLGSTQNMGPGEQKVLGVRWDVSSDYLVYDLCNLAVLSRDLEPTKRQVIGVIGRIYDPIGFLVPVTI